MLQLGLSTRGGHPGTVQLRADDVGSHRGAHGQLESQRRQRYRRRRDPSPRLQRARPGLAGQPHPAAGGGQLAHLHGALRRPRETGVPRGVQWRRPDGAELADELLRRLQRLHRRLRGHPLVRAGQRARRGRFQGPHH